jgi:RHS repeat-associated protein
VTTTLAYSSANQIISRSRNNDVYDFSAFTNGSTGYTANGLNQYMSVAGSSFAYDTKGNLTSGSLTSYTYDTENRLLSASGAHTATLTYDPLGRLSQIVSGSATTQFLYDGDELVAEYDGSGTLLQRYVHGPQTDDPLIWYEGAGVSSAARHSLQANYQGSVESVADASGNPIAINRYDEYGKPAISNIGRFQYTGQAWLSELGLYYYKARVYDPRLGRFLQTDTVGYDDDLNLYAYVGNDPLDRTDPSGDAGELVAAGCAISAEVGCAPGAVVGGVIGGIVYVGGAVYVAWKAHEAIQALSESGPKVNPDKQGKHQPEHPNFQPGKSELDHPDPQGLVDKGAGTGQQVGNAPVGEAGSKERVDFDEPIGTHVDPQTGERNETTVGIIHYGKKDVHIVPARPQPPQLPKPVAGPTPE